MEKQGMNLPKWPLFAVLFVVVFMAVSALKDYLA